MSSSDEDFIEATPSLQLSERRPPLRRQEGGDRTSLNLLEGGDRTSLNLLEGGDRPSINLLEGGDRPSLRSLEGYHSAGSTGWVHFETRTSTLV